MKLFESREEDSQFDRNIPVAGTLRVQSVVKLARLTLLAQSNDEEGRDVQRDHIL